MNPAVKVMNLALRNHAFCIKNDGFCLENGSLSSQKGLNAEMTHQEAVSVRMMSALYIQAGD